MFWKRVVSAIIFSAVVILVIQKGGLWGFLAIVSFVVVLSTLEFSGLTIPKGNSLLLFFSIPINLLFCFSPLKPDWINVNPIFCLAIVLPFVYEIIRRKPHSALPNISSFVLCILYVGWLFGRHIILIRQMPDGINLLYLLVGITWCSDIGAYLVGKQFGKHKIIPAISPSKSLEGYIGGLIFGIAISLALCFWLLPNIKLFHAVIMGLIFTIIGQISDLAESVLKRGANVKDSGKLMPGHGGILDRCDSLVFITPALYYYCIYVLHIN
jgi:phosphatidate cytidylyltransferase